MTLSAGIARRPITPFWGVELAGWGYYLQRTWRRIRDELFATALVLDDGRRMAAIVSLDLMVIGREFTRLTRERIAAATGIPPDAVLLAATHTHNAPASEGLLGVGEVDPVYEDWASRQAAAAAILAFHQREPATAFTGSTEVADLTFNRTREGGPVDSRLTALRVDSRRSGSPVASIVNFQAHPTLLTALDPHAVTRDVPGLVCDRVEASLGGTAMYLQGACGDVNFHPHFQAPEQYNQPVERLAAAAIDALTSAEEVRDPSVSAATVEAKIPARRWTRDEIDADRAEGRRRLKTRDTKGWRETLGRAMTNRPDDMVARHGGDEAKAVAAMARFHVEWTEKMLRDFDSRPEHVATEVQAVRVGSLYIVTNSSELFTAFALDLRRRAVDKPVMIACYANGRIGYMPDAHDLAHRSYAAWQSPKYCNQFPFTEESGPALVAAMVEAIERCD